MDVVAIEVEDVSLRAAKRPIAQWSKQPVRSELSGQTRQAIDSSADASTLTMRERDFAPDARLMSA